MSLAYGDVDHLPVIRKRPDSYIFVHARTASGNPEIKPHRDAYIAHLRRTLKVGGTAIIATFGLDGPMKCSGLPVQRYDPPAIAALLGADFDLVERVNDDHQTPAGAVQAFSFGRFIRKASTR